MGEQVGEAKGVILSVEDMEAGCAFYEEALGYRVHMRDGGRWAILDAGGMRINLAGGDEQLAEPVAVSIKVPDVEAAVARAVRGGAVIASPVKRGEHELKAAVRDPDGHLILFYRSVS